MRSIAQNIGELIVECSWLNQLGGGIVRHGISLFQWRSGGVKHPHDMPPYRFTPSPTFGHSSVHDYLKLHPEMRLMCVIDREDIVGAPKFLICRADTVKLYENDLMESFKAQHLSIGGDAAGHLCVVLTPHPLSILKTPKR